MKLSRVSSGSLMSAVTSPDYRHSLPARCRPRAAARHGLSLALYLHIQRDHNRRRRAQPATRRRARDAEVRGEDHVSGAVDEVLKPVVIALLRTARGRHGPDHRPLPPAAQLLENGGERPPRDDNSRGKVRKVRADSSVPGGPHGAGAPTGGPAAAPTRPAADGAAPARAGGAPLRKFCVSA